MLTKLLKNLSLAALFAFIIVPGLFSQNIDDADIGIITREDGTVYIMHDYAIPFSHGFYVYRSVDGGEWERLTQNPVFPVQNGRQLQTRLGNTFNLIQERMERDNPQSIFLSLRAQTSENTIINAMIPDLARLLGRSFIDEDPPIGSEVGYRFEIVNDLEQPTGAILEKTSVLTTQRPLSPTNVNADHEGRTVQLKWSYPTHEENPDTEDVIQFRTYYRDLETGRSVDATDALLLRTVGYNDFRRHITVPEFDREYEFWVEAVDYSGQASEPSETVILKVKDNIPPAIIRNVQARATEDYHSEISWPVSTEIDLAGYHIYKNRADEEEYRRITEELLPPLQTSYIDEDTKPGVQYRYAVSAVDQNGNEGERSNPVNVYIWDYTLPEPVANLRAQYDEDERNVNLMWEPGEEYQALRTYQILRRQIHPEAVTVYDQLNESSHLDESITDDGYNSDGFREGVTFEYGVVAVSQNGNRSDTVWTDIQIPVLTPPEPPANIQVQMGNTDRVQITWVASTSTDVTSYHIYRHIVAADSTHKIAKRERGQRILRDDTVVLHDEYIYSVTAVDSVGNESEPVVADTLIAHRQQPPPRTRNVQAVYTDERVELRWQVQDKTIIDRYKIYRAEIATGMYEEIAEIEADQTEFIHTESSAGQWFKVYPVDKLGRQARVATAVQAVVR